MLRLPAGMRDPANDRDPRRTFQIVVGALVAVLFVAIVLAILAWVVTRPLSDQAIAATRAAERATLGKVTSTPIPTLAAVTDDLLVCQRQAALAMNARQMAGAVNLADDRLLRLRWVAMDWAIEGLDDALPGVVQGLDAALDAWENGCARYDRVEIGVYDRRAVEDRDRTVERQALRLTVQAEMDDLRAWRAGEIGDGELLERLEVMQANAN